MKKIADSPSGIFGGLTWKKVSSCYDKNYPHLIPLKWGEKKGKLNGRWLCNDGGIYYFSEYFSQVIFWLGISKNQHFSNVGFGTLNESDKYYYTEWGDMILGRNRLNGKMTLYYDATRDQIFQKDSKAYGIYGFGGTVWTRDITK